MKKQARVIAVVISLLASWVSAQTVEYVHTDALGSPVALTNASGAVVERTVYEPYGAVINRALSNGPGYTGHVADAATGLSYMQQRYYDPQLGRFLSNDPVTTTSAGSNFNRYGYANGNPYKFTDPDGRLPVLLVPALIFGAGALFHSEPANAPAPGEVLERPSGGSAAVALLPLPGSGVLIRQSVATQRVAARGGGELTRVGRWMSPNEFQKMSDTGRVIEGAGGRTYVVNPPNPAAFTPSRGSTVYAEFDVPSGVLRPASKPEWAVIPGPNVNTMRYGPPPTETPPATCIVCVIRKKP
jgi:RHS repeat-associated protein